MKIKLLSDLHMEGWDFKYEYDGEDVLVLAGDIHTKNRHEEIINQVPETVQILLVAGNHEFYHQDYNSTLNYLGSLDFKYHNVTFLYDDWTSFDGVEFFGGTMFTDFTLNGLSEAWFVKQAVKDVVSDFHVITNGTKPWTTFDHEQAYRKFLNNFTYWLNATEDTTRVVITHFMPTPVLTPAKYASSIANPYFTQNMEEYMGWRGLWLCGHGHDSNDIMLGDTRVVMNPRGYGTENLAFNPNLILEI